MNTADIKVLHLDDNRSDAELVRFILEEHFPESTYRHVTDRTEFEKSLLADSFDIVLLDYDIPDFSGLEALDLVLKDRPDSAVIFVSGAIDVEQALDCMRLGAIDYVMKENMQKLPLTMERVLTEQQERDAKIQAEQKLLESENRWRSITESSTDHIMLIGPDLTVLSINHTLPDLKKEDVIGKSIFDLLPQAMHRSVKTEYEEVFRTGKPNSHETTYQTANGEVNYFDVRLSPIVENGNVVSVISTSNNITERKQEQVAFADKTYLLSQAEKVAHIGSYLLDINSGNWTSSDMLNKIFGIEIEHVRDVAGWQKIIHPEERERMMDYFTNSVLADHGKFNMEYRIVRQNDNEVRWVHGLGELEIRKDGVPITMTGSIQDITERKEAEKLLRRSDAILQEISSVVLLTDAKCNVTYASPSTEKMTGYKAEDILGNNWWDLSFVTPKQGRQQKRRLAAYIKDADNVNMESYQRQVKCRDGSLKWFEWHNTKGVDGSIIAVGHDVTDKVAVDNEMRKLSLAVEQSPTSVVITDLKGDIEYVNPRFEQTTGYSAKEVTGKNPRILKSGHTDAKEYKHLWNTISKGKTWTGEFHNKKKDGTLYWEKASIGPIVNEDGKTTHYLAMKEDITEMKQTEHKLRNLLQNMEAMVEERTEKLRVTTEELEYVHNEFMSSLQYAQRIQEAILPSKTELKKAFKDAFSIYKPKDVVSGDFYWHYKGVDEVVLVLADCTGHGVPGALMSMAGHELLDSIVVNRKIWRPEVILEEMDLAIAKLMKRQDARFILNDGMDMSVVHIDHENGVFSFSGAQSHGLFFRKGEMIELKPDRESIGGMFAGKFKEFSRQRFEFEHGDRFYLYSDGIYDQFGGPDCKKMLRRNWVKLIKETYKLSMSEQRKALKKAFEKWMGDEKQTDDVTVLGIEL